MNEDAATRARAVSVLKKLPVFRDLGEEEYDRVFDVCRSRFVQEGATVFREGDVDRSLYVLLHGGLDILTRGRGRVHRMEAGEVLGEVGLVSALPRTATAVASRSSMLLELDADALQELFAGRPRIGWIVMRNLAATLAERLARETRRDGGGTV